MKLKRNGVGSGKWDYSKLWSRILQTNRRASRFLREHWLLTISLFVFFILVLPSAFRDTVIVDTISVPKLLDETGYKPDVLSSEIRDECTRIEEAIVTHARKDELLGISDTFPDIEVPETKLSSKSAIQVVQHLTGHEPRHFSGEIICTSPNCSAKDQELVVSCRMTQGPRIVDRQRLRAHDVDDAVVQLSEILLSQLNPYLLGRYIDEIKHDPGRACLIYQKGAENPNYPYRAWSYNGWANALLREGKLEEAVRRYDQAIELQPKNSFLYCNLGEALLLQGPKYLPAAKEAYAKAASLGPDSTYLHSLSGGILAAEGKLEEAAVEYQKATILDPKNASAFYGWGRILWSRNARDQAMDKFNRASELDPRFKESIQLLTSDNARSSSQLDIKEEGQPDKRAPEKKPH